MDVSVRFSRGRADPFGLLVVAVMLALSITVGIQAQASMVGERSAPVPVRRMTQVAEAASLIGL